MKLAIVASIVGSVAAFAPSTSHLSSSAVALRSSAADNMNGWIIDESKPCYGLPGAPYSFMDPLGIARNRSVSTVKRLREAEVMHGRVAMMASVGYIIGESTPTIGYGMDVHHTIANNQLAELPLTLLLPFFIAVNFAEAYRANKGWVDPKEGSLFTLRDGYYPGDLGFDPLGLKPKNAKAFSDMQDGELNNGRLAMLAALGMCVQEQVSNEGILQHLGL